jgi:hypothetical protein
MSAASFCANEYLVISPDTTLNPWYVSCSNSCIRSIMSSGLLSDLLHFTMPAMSILALEAQGMEKPNVAPGPSLAMPHSFPL